MNRLIRCFVLILFFTSVKAQQDSVILHRKLELIKRVSVLIKDSLKLETGDHYFTDFIENDSMFNYVYVSYKDSIKKVTKDAFIYFENHPSEARFKADSFMNAGYDVMLYKTAGTSDAKLNRRLVEYDDLSLVFIMIHEALHRHKHNTKSKISYDKEEALCDVIANAYCGWMSGVSEKEHVYFVYCNEKIYELINSCSSGKISKEKCNKKIRIQLKNGTVFQRDRFDYAVNNAYLLRYSNYAKNYFKLAKLFTEHDRKINFVKEYLGEAK